MKSTERHHLKENELSEVLGQATERLMANRSALAIVAGVVALAVAIGGGYWAWTARAESRSQAMLAEALLVVQAPIEEPKPGVTPTAGSYPNVNARAEAALTKLAAVYEAYPSARAGIAARYYAGSALTMLGRPAEAAARFQEVADRAGSSDFYGRMARLGVIEANAQAKQFDQAISAAQALVNDTTDDTIPRDALLMELGRVQAAAGKKAEAKQTLDKVIADFPQSVYVEEARRLLETVT
jgi:tetratricopeptide (TPR) repeat protein